MGKKQFLLSAISKECPGLFRAVKKDEVLILNHKKIYMKAKLSKASFARVKTSASFLFIKSASMC